jgi:hypothetical protein
MQQHDPNGHSSSDQLILHNGYRSSRGHPPGSNGQQAQSASMYAGGSAGMELDRPCRQGIGTLRLSPPNWRQTLVSFAS